MATPRDIVRVLDRLKFKTTEKEPGIEHFQSKDKRIGVSVFDNGQWIVSWEEVRERGSGAVALLRQLKGLLKSGLKEMTGTGAVGGFATPYAFSTKEPVSSKRKKKTTSINEEFERLIEGHPPGSVVRYLRGFKAVNPDGTEEAILKDRKQAHEFAKTGMVGGDPNWDEHGEYITPITEGGDPYYAWRNDETATPQKKIARVISEMNRQLAEMERVVRRSQRLQKEMGVPNSDLWKRTNMSLMKIESRMHRISQSVRNMRG